MRAMKIIKVFLFFLLSGIVNLQVSVVQSAMLHPWAMFQGDSRHTGRSLYPGPRVPSIAFKNEIHGLSEGAPVVAADGTIYVSSHTGKICAFSPSGTKKWEFTTFDVIRGTPTLGPDNTIYVGSKDGGLYAINQDGSLKWVYLTHDQIISPPTLSQDGTTIYVSSSSKGLFAIGTEGKLKWNLPLDAWITASSPAIGNDGTIYIGGYGGGGGNVFGIYPDGSLRWSYSTPEPVRTTPAIADDGTIYIGTRGGELYAFSPDGIVKWIFTAKDEIRASAAIDFNGTIYVGSYDKNLYALNPDGTLKWSFLLDGIVEASPIVDSEGVIYVAPESGVLHLIGRGGILKGTVLGTGVHHSSLAIGSNGTLYASGDFSFFAVGPNQLPTPDLPTNPGIEILTEKWDYYLGDTLIINARLYNPTLAEKNVEVKIYMKDSLGVTTSFISFGKVAIKPNASIIKNVYTHVFDVNDPTRLYWIGARLLLPETGDYINQDFKTVTYNAN